MSFARRVHFVIAFVHRSGTNTSHTHGMGHEAEFFHASLAIVGVVKIENEDVVLMRRTLCRIHSVCAVSDRILRAGTCSGASGTKSTHKLRIPLVVHFDACVPARIDAIEDIIERIIVGNMEAFVWEHSELGSTSARLPGGRE